MQIHRLQSPVTVLGPGSRAVIWVQGCNIGCHGCLAPYMHDFDKGVAMSIGEVAQWILHQENVQGITLSGGEPTVQSEELVAIIDIIRKNRDFSVVCYTGRTFEDLNESRDNHILDLLDRIDLLVDGPYIQSRHADILWRGSSNQRLIPLTNRYRSIVEALDPITDKSAGLEFTSCGETLYYVGVPTDPDFDKKIRQEMNLYHLINRKPSK